MKNFINNIINNDALCGLFALVVVIGFFAVMVVADNYDLIPQSSRNQQLLQYAKEKCEARGGKLISNPHGFLAFTGKMNGQGCSLDYARWEEYKAEWRAENQRIREEEKQKKLQQNKRIAEGGTP